jgi:uncharacterized protein (TIGR00369 family)
MRRVTEQPSWIDPAVWTEPVRGGFPDPALLGLTGLEQIRTFFRGQAPAPPIRHLTGMMPTEAGPGSATFTMPATGWLVQPPGYLPLGVLAIVADGALGCAIQTALPPATPYTTSDLSLSFLRPARADGHTLAAEGRAIHAGRSLALSEGLIRDGQGRPLSHATSRCFVLQQIDPPPQPPDPLPTVDQPAYGSPDPFERPPVGRPLEQEVWDRLTGLEVMRGFIAGELPAPPLSHLTGLRPVAADEGTATFVMPSSPWLCSPAGTVEGGAIALLADTVLATAVQTTLPRRTAYTPLDLKVNYLRPVFPDDRELTGRGTVTHRGRTLAVAGAELRNADGKLVAVATGTTFMREGRPWHLEEEEPRAGPEED